MVMRTTAPIVLAALLALPALARQQEEQSVAKPDYSKDTLIRIFSVDIGTPEREKRIEYEFGAISFKALGQRWRYSYLPFLAPLQGSRFNHVTQSSWPDPFTLTNTEIAQTPRTYRARRARTAELRRIERITRGKGTVVVKP